MRGDISEAVFRLWHVSALCSEQKPLGIGMQTAMIIAFIITALWWLLSSVPLLRSLQTEIFCRSKRTCCKKTVLSGLGKLFAELVKEKHIFVFLLAFSFILTVCIPLLIWRQRTDRLLIGQHGTFCRPSCDTDRCVSVCTYFRKDRKESFSGEDHYCLYHGIFWNCSVCNIGWILSLISGCSQFLWECSRERYRRFQDHILRRSYRGEVGEYFGIYDICGKGASVIGTALVSSISQMTGSINIAKVSALSVMFLVGLVLFRYSGKIK